MSRRVSWILVTFALLLSPMMLSAQQQQEQATFLFVSEWSIPRAQWADWTAFGEKNVRPIFERMIADGTVLGWGLYTTIIHQENGTTHGSWFETASIAAGEKVLAELAKLPPSPIQTGAATKHHDHLIRTALRRTKAGSGSNGYLWVSMTQVQPGKGQEWRQLWDKYNKATYDELLASGTISRYEIDVEQVHTETPALRYVVYLAPNVEAFEKARAAFQAAGQRRGPEENRAMGEAFAAVTVAGTHRDYFARVNSYAQK